MARGTLLGSILQRAPAFAADSGAPCPPMGIETVGWHPAGGRCVTVALIPSWRSLAFAPAMPLDRLIEIVTVPSWLRVTPNAGVVLVAPSTSASAAPTPATATATLVAAISRGPDEVA